MIEEHQLRQLYLGEKLSIRQIAQRLGCSQHKVTYWMDMYHLPRRSVSDAVYLKYHPKGDPFQIKPPASHDEAKLYGLGVGLYWGQGVKSSRHSVRLRSAEPALLRTFMEFLEKLCDVSRESLRFGLQIFSDMDEGSMLNFWANELGVDVSQFYKVNVMVADPAKTYRMKSPQGVVTVHFHNKKLRDILMEMLPS